VSWFEDADEDEEHEGYDDEHKTSERAIADVASGLSADVFAL